MDKLLKKKSLKFDKFDFEEEPGVAKRKATEMVWIEK